MRAGTHTRDDQSIFLRVHDTPQSIERTGINREVLDIQKLLVEVAIGRNGCVVDQLALGQALCLLTATF